MSDIMINTERKYSATVIPNVFIDRFLPSANGSYVKVYLYLLRCLTGNEMQFSISSAADFFDETESDITRALKYWEKNEVIRLTRNGSEITGITLLDLTVEQLKTTTKPAKANVISINNIRTEAQKPETKVSEPPVENVPEAPAPMSVPTLTREEINKALVSEPVSWLMNAVEMYLERPLTEADQNLVIFLYRDLHFSSDLLLHLYEVCIGRNKRNISYIQSVAIDWYEHGISTVDEADGYSVVYSNYFSAVNKAFNLGRLPGDKEQKYIRSWENMGFSPEMVKEACDRTLLKCSKPSFAYANKILVAWNEEGIKGLSALAEKDKSFSEAKNAKKSKPGRSVSKSAENYLNRYSQREYSAEDMKEIERLMLEKSLGISIKQEG